MDGFLRGELRDHENDDQPVPLEDFEAKKKKCEEKLATMSEDNAAIVEKRKEVCEADEDCSFSLGKLFFCNVEHRSFERLCRRLRSIRMSWTKPKASL